MGWLKSTGSTEETAATTTGTAKPQLPPQLQPQAPHQHEEGRIQQLSQAASQNLFSSQNSTITIYIRNHPAGTPRVKIMTILPSAPRCKAITGV